MNEEAVEPQEVEQIEQVLDQAIVADQQAQENNDHDKHDKTMVPLSALQKERLKRKELELENQWMKQKYAQPAQSPIEEDNSRYESATKEDLHVSRDEAIREIEERLWIRQNPEKYEKINDFLPNFLKQRPNLASAINQAGNRYEEAYTLMEALTPRQQQQVKQAAPPRKESPNSPGGMPKAAAMNASVDVMKMSDKEFSDWKAAQKRSR